MAELSEYEQKMSEWMFPQGWNDPTCLKYIAEEDIDSYEKHFSFDVFEDCKDTFQYMEENELFKEDYFKQDIYRCLPVIDKEIDYFLSNNKNWAVIINSCRNTVYDHKKDQNDIKMAEIQQEIQNIRTECADEVKEKLDWVREHLGLLKEWGDPRHNELARESIDLAQPYLLKKDTKPTGSDPKNIERNSEIRQKVDALVGTLIEVNGVKIEVTHTMAFKSLTEEYPKLLEGSIKKIYYAYDWIEKVSK